MLDFFSCLLTDWHSLANPLVVVVAVAVLVEEQEGLRGGILPLIQKHGIRPGKS